MKRRLGRLIVTLAGCVLVVAGVASADRCHQRLAGTRSLTVNAELTSYRFVDGGVAVEWARSGACAGETLWNYRTRSRTTASVSCQHAAPRQQAAVPSALAASDAGYAVRVVPAPASSDEPDRLLVRAGATGRTLAAWPMIARPARVALYSDIAILSASGRGAVWALRVSDGRIAQIGIARAGDRPVIGPQGVLYQNDLDLAKHRTVPRQRTLNLLPLRTVRRELARPFTTTRMYMSYTRTAPPAASALRTTPLPYRGADPARPFTSPPITAMSMDGQRVALAIHDPQGRCDYVLFWNVPWHYVTRLTRASGSTCRPGRPAARISDVAIAGSRAVWTTTSGREARVIAASITGCVEWVVARPAGSASSVAGLSGDGITLAYALRRLTGAVRQTESVGIVPRHWQGAAIERGTGQVKAISADGDRVAVLHTNGLVEILSRAGEQPKAIQVGSARSISLRAATLAVLTTHGRLDIYSTNSRKLTRSWKAPTDARSLDLHYGIALLTTRRRVFAIDVRNGHMANLLYATSRVFAQLEGPGAAVAFNSNGHAHLRFLPMSTIEARLR